MMKCNFFTRHRREILWILFFFGLACLAVLWMKIDSDYWWHLKIGEYQLQHHKILHTDLFSWYGSPYSLPWIAHEWLFEILLASFNRLWNPTSSAIILSVGLFLGLFLVLFFCHRKEWFQNQWFSFFWTMLGFCFVCHPLMPRAQWFCWIFVALSLYLLFDLRKNAHSKKIYFLPFLTIFWANIHGGSSNLSYLLCFVFLFIGQFSFSNAKIEAKKITSLQTKKYLLVFFLCMGSILLNPNGIQMLFYPYQNFLDASMQSMIAEWRPSNPNLLIDVGYFLFLGFLLFLLIRSSKKISLLDLILLLMFCFLGFKSVRFWPLFFVVTTSFIFSYIVETKRAYPFPFEILVGIIGGFFLLLFAFRVKDVSVSLNKPPVDSKIISYLQKYSDARLLNDYNLGGYLIYCDIPVFIDGRADLYSHYNLRDYYSLIHLDGDFPSLLRHYDFDFFLFESGSRLSIYLRQQEMYEVAVQTDRFILYQKKGYLLD